MVFLGRFLPFLFSSPQNVNRDFTIMKRNSCTSMFTPHLHMSSTSTLQDGEYVQTLSKTEEVESKINVEEKITGETSPTSKTLDSSTETYEKEDISSTILKPSSSLSSYAAGDLLGDAKSIYSNLANANYSLRYSPAIRFSHVPASSSLPNKSWTCEKQRDFLGLDESEEPEVDGEIKVTDAGIREKALKRIAEVSSESSDGEKVVLLYLPGLDGGGVSATQQFDDLSNAFEFWRMSVNPGDTSTTFLDLVLTASKFVEEVINTSSEGSNRKVVIVGESFGGLLAPAVVERLRNRLALKNHRNTESDVYSILGMVLVNPATSFGDTQWNTLAPLLASLELLNDNDGLNTSKNSLPTAYSVAGGITLAALIPDSTQLRRIVDIILNTPSSSSTDLQKILDIMREGFGILAQRLPGKVIAHRVSRWLTVGSDIVNPRLPTLDIPTLVISGDDDNFLPTKKESERLVKVMPNCTSYNIKEAGHFVLDNRVNLTDIIVNSYFDPLGVVAGKKEALEKYDPITDWKLPPPDVIEETIRANVQPLRDLTSPVFFSTGVDGKRRKGLGFLPNMNDDVNGASSKPVLFVANHQLFGLDLGMIIAQLLEERGIMARGLAHPIIFGGIAGLQNERPLNGNRQSNRNGDGQATGFNDPSTFQKFGAVMVTPRNYYRLMQTGQTGLLFPGGVREVFHGKDEAYQLFWPSKVDFVRIAAKFNATIVPLSAVGAADSVNVLVDAPDMLNLPFGLGERLTNSTRNTISARFDAEKEEELFVTPFAVPKLPPARHYFLFGTPIDTTGLDHQDKANCEELYAEVKREVERGFEDVLRAREKDPWGDSATRIAYERLTNKQAPTFSVDELNQQF
mmetsp:Transcript_18559/g.26113  ORF Transcript_18559/g.26113 Transcript_18559/m.26113 type:complete len:856 (-) Transcript_18559:50-2617(-)